MANRLDKLRNLMAGAEVDILALVPGPNLRYLTGGVHYMMERPIILFVPIDAPLVAVIPEMEIPIFERHSIQSKHYAWKDADGYDKAFQTALADMGAGNKTVGVEGLHMRYFESQIIARHVAGLQDMSEALINLRIIKEPEEIELLRRAIQISEAALTATLKEVAIGMSEIEIANILEAHLKAGGAEALSFGTILHGGGNSALPHAGPLEYRIQAGDPLLFDFGAVYQGYHADITRTVFVREASSEFRAFYEVVQAANAAGRATAKPNVPAESVDAAARAVIVEAGYESLMRARIGHGLGLETHEPPYIVGGNQQLLQPGMTFTIEPGMYDANRIGVRIEDDMLITPDGAESLTTFSREIMVLDI